MKSDFFNRFLEWFSCRIRHLWSNISIHSIPRIIGENLWIFIYKFRIFIQLSQFFLQISNLTQKKWIISTNYKHHSAIISNFISHTITNGVNDIIQRIAFVAIPWNVLLTNNTRRVGTQRCSASSTWAFIVHVIRLWVTYCIKDIDWMGVLVTKMLHKWFTLLYNSTDN